MFKKHGKGQTLEVFEVSTDSKTASTQSDSKVELKKVSRTCPVCARPVSDSCAQHSK